MAPDRLEVLWRDEDPECGGSTCVDTITLAGATVSSPGTCPRRSPFCGNWQVQSVRAVAPDRIEVQWRDLDGECGGGTCTETITLTGVESCS